MKSCREVAWLVSSGEWERQRGWPRWAVLMHMQFCGHCSRLARQLRQIGHRSRTAVEDDAPPQLEERIVRRLTELPPKS